MKRKTGIAIAVVFLLTVAGLSYAALRGTRLLDSMLDNGYDSESYSYEVTASPAANGSFSLLLPYPQLIAAEIKCVDGNATFVQQTGEHGPCLNATWDGPFRLLAENSRKLPLGSDLLHGDLALTMTNMTNDSKMYTGRQTGYSAWLWSSRDNVSLELTFSSGATRHRSETKWAAGEGYFDKLNCTLRAGWQNLTMERNWWIT